MTRLLSILRQLLAVTLSVFFFFLTLGQDIKPFAPTDAENLRLGVALIADIHMEGNNMARFKLEAKSFKNLAGGKDFLDALVLLGDNTMNGQAGEYGFLFGLLEHINPIRPYYLILGNHDVGNSADANYPMYRDRFIGNLQTFVDSDLETAYYAKVVNGYHMIFLAPDNAEVNGRLFSDAQLDFLEAELKAAAETGKPVFVFNHHPSRYVDDACYDRFIELMNSYDKIFFIVGHMHYYYRFQTVPGKMGTPEIWVPNLGTLDGEGDDQLTDQSGRGYLMEVYDDSVMFRAFNYYTNTFYGENDKTYFLGDDAGDELIPVPGGPVIFDPITPPVIDPPVIPDPSTEAE